MLKTGFHCTTFILRCAASIQRLKGEDEYERSRSEVTRVFGRHLAELAAESSKGFDKKIIGRIGVRAPLRARK